MTTRSSDSRVDLQAVIAAAAAGIVFGSFFFLFLPLQLRAKARAQAEEMIKHQPYVVQSVAATDTETSVTLTGKDGVQLNVKRRSGASGYAEFSMLKDGQQISFCPRPDDPPFYASGGGTWNAYVGVCAC